MKMMRQRRRARGLCELRLMVADARSRLVRRRLAKQVASLDRERDALQWIDSVSEFDADAARWRGEQYHWGEAIMAHVAKRNPDRCPIHPGALLREDVIPATGKAKAEIAQLLGISRQHLYDILRERKPVSPGVAVRFGKLFGDGAGVWVRMQAAYDTWHAEREEDVSGIPTLRTRAAW
jgi:antitoxin HigA-1